MEFYMRIEDEKSAEYQQNNLQNPYEMIIKSELKFHQLLRTAIKLLKEHGKVVFHGESFEVQKSVNLAERLKSIRRDLKEEIEHSHVQYKDLWSPKSVDMGLDNLEVTRHVPTISIALTEEKDKQHKKKSHDGSVDMQGDHFTKRRYRNNNKEESGFSKHRDRKKQVQRNNVSQQQEGSPPHRNGAKEEDSTRQNESKDADLPCRNELKERHSTLQNNRRNRKLRHTDEEEKHTQNSSEVRMKERHSLRQNDIRKKNEKTIEKDERHTSHSSSVTDQKCGENNGKYSKQPTRRAQATEHYYYSETNSTKGSLMSNHEHKSLSSDFKPSKRSVKERESKSSNEINGANHSVQNSDLFRVNKENRPLSNYSRTNTRAKPTQNHQQEENLQASLGENPSADGKKSSFNNCLPFD